MTNIYIGGNVQGSNIISGDNNVVTQNIRDSFNKADSADIQAELKETLKQLAEAVSAMSKSMPEEQAAEVAEDLGNGASRIDGDDDVGPRRLARAALVVDTLSGAMGARRSFNHRAEVYPMRLPADPG